VRRAALAAALVLAALAGCGGDDEGEASGDLVWAKRPRLYLPPGLERDRILTGVVRNDSFERIDLTARDLRVETRDGERVPSAAVFGESFRRGVFPQNRGEGTPESEQIRIGLKLRLRPGKKAPLTVSWRQASRDRRPVRVDYGAGSLPVPRG
jgi:hypothetical protein